MAKTKAAAASKKQPASKASAKNTALTSSVGKPGLKPAKKGTNVKKTIPARLPAKKAGKASVSKAVAKSSPKPVKKVAPISKSKPSSAVATKPALAAAKDGCPPGSPWLIPTLIVRTVEAAIDFYQRAFGFTVDFTMPSPTGTIGYAQLRHHSALIHLSPEGAYGSTCRAPATSTAECPAMIYIYCPDVDALVVRASQAGATILSQPADMFWGDRTALLADPDGYRWAFATNIAAFDASRPPPPDYPQTHAAG
jgi:uncharacterized glyoxalase superfamily protein PhnB